MVNKKQEEEIDCTFMIFYIERISYKYIYYIYYIYYTNYAKYLKR